MRHVGRAVVVHRERIAVSVKREGVGRVGIAGGGEFVVGILGVAHCRHDRLPVHPLLGREPVQVVELKIPHAAVGVGDAGDV